MKKLLQFVFLFVFMVTFVSCEKGNTDISGVYKDFSSEISVKCKSGQFGGELTRTEGGLIEIRLNSPEELSGVILKSDGGDFTLAFEDMFIDLDGDNPFDDSFAGQLCSILDNCTNSENIDISGNSDGSLICGSIEDGEYRIDFLKDGKIQKITLADSELQIDFTNFEFIN